MKTWVDLRRYYNESLIKDLERLEKIRTGIVRGIWKGAAVTAGITAAVFAAALLLRAHPGLAALPAAGGVLVVGWSSWTKRKSFARWFKEQVIGKIVEFVDPDLSYHPDRGISENQFMGCGIFQKNPDRYRCEDAVFGAVGKTEISFSEVHAEYKTQHTDSKGRTRTQWHTIFKGLFFIGDFHKEFRTRVFVLPDTAERMFGFLGSMLQSWNQFRPPVVKMEDPEFEKEFVVYGDDPIESRYILSHSLVERILTFRRKTGSRVHLSFVDSRVFVAIPFSRNLFEPRLFSTLLDFEPVREYFEDLSLAVGIVEDFNLNTRIWTKK